MIIIKLRKSNLRQMMRDELVDDQIKKTVLQGLKPLVVYNADAAYTHGDLKETCHFYFFIFVALTR